VNFDKIFVLGFPKSGTTTVDTALRESGLKTAHWHSPKGFCGELIYKAYNEGVNPLKYLNDYDCVTQADVCSPSDNLNYWPNLDFGVIKQIERYNPKCLFLLNTRKPEDILSSFKRWGFYDKRIRRSEIPGLPAGIGNDKNIISWINSHYNHCREYFYGKDNYLEIDIYQNDCRERMQQKLGIEIKWWGVANKNAEEGVV